MSPLRVFAFLTLLQHIVNPSPLPEDIDALLSSRFPGWRLADTNSPAHAGSDIGVSNVLRGDYDGDGVLDYAIFIDYETSESSGPTRKWFTRVLAFLSRPRAVAMLPVTEPLPHRDSDTLVMRPAPKGSKGFDMNTNQEFVHDRDGIIVHGDAGPCYTFTYHTGKFVRLWTCD